MILEGSKGYVSWRLVNFVGPFDTVVFSWVNRVTNNITAHELANWSLWNYVYGNSSLAFGPPSFAEVVS